MLFCNNRPTKLKKRDKVFIEKMEEEEFYLVSFFRPYRCQGRHGQEVRIGDDNKTIAYGDSDSIIRLISLASGLEYQRMPNCNPNCRIYSLG